MLPTHIGRYRVTRLIGQGGMGVVYAAHDDRLDRPVAIKVVRPEAVSDERARERFRREARAAARVSHPHICPLYEFDEADGHPFLVMELLEGEPLSVRLARGAMPLDEALTLAQTMLDALAALHRRGIMHRDLKPANVFLTPHGLKLLDFGVAQPITGEDDTRERELTGPNMLIGTPQYMAPEQLLKGRIDERVDIFAAGAVIYEMLAGHPAFRGASLPELVHAIGYEDPAPLDGTPELAAFDAVLRRALAKTPDDRPARADILASLLREATDTPLAVPRPRARVTRFVALPLRVLRPDPETDFLAFSVPDAVSVALATLESVLVRPTQSSTPAAAVDVRALGRELSVDVVLTGTLLRAGQHVRVSAQLADVAAGTIIWSDVAQAPIEDLFQLQDTLTQHIVSSLALPLTTRDRRSLERHAPASAQAYELYMRANQMMTDTKQWEAARSAYERAVELDPDYAPAWARLGRARRVLAKWGGPAGIGLLPEAEAAFRRAFALDPDLSIAHDLAAYVDAELGRAPEAMERLLRRAAARPADTGVLAGLVTTCRYAGLLEQSRAAHERALALDAGQSTSVAWTHLLLGDYENAIRTDGGSPPFCQILARFIRGDFDLDALRALESSQGSPGTRLGLGVYTALAEGDLEQATATMELLRQAGFADPEGWYVYAFLFVSRGALDQALELLTRAIDGGYACHRPLVEQPQWSPLRGVPAFDALAARAEALMADARRRFAAAGGTAILASRDLRA